MIKKYKKKPIVIEAIQFIDTAEVMNKEIKVLTEENKFLKKPWYVRLFSL